jgi:hypothetical protein
VPLFPLTLMGSMQPNENQGANENQQPSYFGGQQEPESGQVQYEREKTYALTNNFEEESQRS